MKQKIALKYCNGIVTPELMPSPLNVGHSMSFISEMMAYGYMPDEELAEQLTLCTVENITSLYNEIIPLLKESVGANVKHKPFYPNFPEQVMDASEAKLYLNAMGHYWTKGLWVPNYTIAERPVGFENTKFKMLGVVSETDIDNVFTQIISSADSISGFSKEVIGWFIAENRMWNEPAEIPFKENVCVLAGELIKVGIWNSSLIKDTTDVLRIVTFMNDGDISLAEKTKFKSMPRKVRKMFCTELERVAKEEDFLRHKEKWVKLLHNLHVGDYSKSLYAIAKKLRENIKIETFNSKIELAMQVADIPLCIELLSTRPGIFARKIIDLIYKDVRDHNGIVRAFKKVVDDVPARNLTQLWGAVKIRDKVVDKRVVFPKGSVARAYVLRNEMARLVPEVRLGLIDVIQCSLRKRFNDIDDLETKGEEGGLGKVYIEPALYECPLPTAMRSASESLRECARGTRMPMGDKDALRFFAYWKGNDIDLSASFHSENFDIVEQISYTHTRAHGIKAYHSGDITHAPRGASEFIDIDIASALASNMNIRYVVMNVLSYSGEKFSDIETCFAGWMTRDKLKSNEIFEPKTVEQKVDINGEGVMTIPAIFDLKERKVIWTDIVSGNRSGFNFSKWGRSGNNVENNHASIQETIEAFTSLDNKITLGELFQLHAEARGELVSDKAEADTIFAMDEGVTPFDIATINSEYL